MYTLAFEKDRPNLRLNSDKSEYLVNCWIEVQLFSDGSPFMQDHSVGDSPTLWRGERTTTIQANVSISEYMVSRLLKIIMKKLRL